jgi:predicted Zn finger-like uncharacterized protein
MIITCPNCQTRYQIAPESLGESGRTVRCSGCGQRWFAAPPAEAASAPPLPPASPALSHVATPSPAAGRKQRRGSLLGWLLLTLLVLLAAALLAGRNEIVAQFPQVLPLYQRLGIPVRLPLGVEFRDLGSEQRIADGRRQLVVSGGIVNVSGQARDLPPIRVGLLDKERREIDSARFDPPQPTLEPGAMARFTVTVQEPPEAAESFTVSFGDLP